MREEILYVFGGEKAQGAEIVIERLMNNNIQAVSPHLLIAPGRFANTLVGADRPYRITLLKSLKKLNRSKSNKFMFYLTAVLNYVRIPFAVYKYIKANKITTIHANTIVPASYLLPLIKMSKILLPGRRWLWSDHDMKYFASLDLALAKHCIKAYDKTLVVSAAVASKYPRCSKINVLYNGLDMDIFKADRSLRQIFRERINAAPETKIFGIAASICPGKGVMSLIEQFNALSGGYQDSLLAVAGNYADDDHEYNEQVKHLIAMSPRVIYLGFVEDMLAFYNGCDVIISNSDLARSESLGTTIYEAMSCEKIVLASETGGTPEIITHGVDGFLFEADNDEALKAALSAVMASPLSENIGIAARRKVAEKFSIEVMKNNYNDILRSIRGKGTSVKE